jgi:tetratricopeptide (TPR) repeat protein
MLMVATRWSGSVGDRPSEEWMADLRARGRRLLKRANNPHAIGRFLAADAFFPFWIQGLREPTAEDLAQSRASANRAIEIATQLDDPDLLSTALDSTTGVNTAVNDWPKGLETARRRVAFEERLGLYERLDAHSMVAWMSYLMGDLATAEKDSGEMAARLLPGQAPYPALHLFAWRSLTLMMLGRWDEAVAAFYRGLEAWHDAGSHAAGYGFRGFVAGLDIGRARGDARLAGAAIDAIESILARFPSSHNNQLLRFYIRGESGLTANDPFLSVQYAWEAAERRISLACDRREQLPREVLEQGLATAVRVRVPLLEAQVRRARGLAYRDASELSQAIETWERIGVVPQLGRAKAERGLLNGDAAETEAGLAILKKLGDVNYLDRFAARV